MYTIHATKKLLDRVKQPIAEPVSAPSTALGNWYATAIFWKPQVAFFMNERTLLPVLVPLAPAATLAQRFPDQLAMVLEALQVPIDFVFQEVGAMQNASYAKTASRSVLGNMNSLVYLAQAQRDYGEAMDLVEHSAHLAGTPCRRLNKEYIFPDQELASVVAETFST